MSETLLSIIIPSYNRMNSIGKTMDSVYRQMAKQVEVIVVDDGSTDSTKNFIAEHYPKVKYLYQENKGVCAARNHGATVAKGRFLYFLDSDDRIKDGTLNGLLCEIRKEEYIALFILPAFIYSKDKDLKRSIETKNLLAQRLTGAFCIKKDLFHDLGKYDENLKFSENSDLFMRIREEGESFKKLIKPSLTGGVIILQESDLIRKDRYSRIKYDSLKYLLNKHEHYFKKHPKHDKVFRSTLAFQAFYNKNYQQARSIVKQLIIDYPGYWKAYRYLLMFSVPALAKKYYNGRGNIN